MEAKPGPVSTVSPARGLQELPPKVLGADHRVQGPGIPAEPPDPPTLQRVTFLKKESGRKPELPTSPQASSLFLSCFRLYHVAHGTLVPQLGIGPCSLLWKHRPVTTGPAQGLERARCLNPCLGKSVPKFLDLLPVNIAFFQGG